MTPGLRSPPFLCFQSTKHFLMARLLTSMGLSLSLKQMIGPVSPKILPLSNYIPISNNTLIQGSVLIVIIARTSVLLIGLVCCHKVKIKRARGNNLNPFPLVRHACWKFLHLNRPIRPEDLPSHHTPGRVRGHKQIHQGPYYSLSLSEAVKPFLPLSGAF